jgi:cytochrome c-type biogenesis protein CcmH/NrfG
VTVTRWRAASALWPLALLAVFIGTFRRPHVDGGPVAANAECEQWRAQPGTGDIAALEGCLALEPSNAALLVDAGRAYQSAGRVNDAERLYRRALTLDVSNSDLHVQLGELMLGRGDVQGARLEGAAALRWRPNSLAATRLVERASAAAP